MTCRMLADLGALDALRIWRFYGVAWEVQWHWQLELATRL